MADNFAISEAYAALVEFAMSRGARNLAAVSGAWHAVVDDQWAVWLNPHRDAIKLDSGPEVPPFECYVEFNGWPAGIFGPRGGVIAAGALANEGTFIDALKTATGMPAGYAPYAP